jgi:hypothetical protein
MGETRYAILIGNNDYKDPKLPPLNYAIKDVEDFGKMLEEHCRFPPGNIYSITNSAIPIQQQIEEALSKIKANFRTKEDLFLFYFSGHGQYNKHEEQSNIIFEDGGELNVNDIIASYFPGLNPKNSYLLIDACQSGPSLKRKGITTEKHIRVLDANASGMYMMFATQNIKSAFEDPKYKNSYFTHFFIEAVKSEGLYDIDGLLTMQVIDNYIKKYVGKESEHYQVPVSELHGTGYKPFAFLKSKMKSEIKKNAEDKPSVTPKADDSEKKLSPAAVSFEQSLNRESRLAIQQAMKEVIDIAFEALQDKLQGRDFTIGENFDDLPSTHKIYREIIFKARKENAEGMDEMFEVKEKEKNPFQSDLSFTFAITQFLQQQEPQYTYHIYSGTEFFDAKHIYVRGDSVYDIRGGLAVMVYQTKFGFAVGSTLFHYDWTGMGDTKIIVTGTTIKPYTINGYKPEKVTAYIRKTIARFPEDIKGWTDSRKKEIEDYQKKADKD